MDFASFVGTNAQLLIDGQMSSTQFSFALANLIVGLTSNGISSLLRSLGYNWAANIQLGQNLPPELALYEAAARDLGNSTDFTFTFRDVF